ncbi:MAG: hypothetical protein GY869_32930, partial [Planctomycetes bacterium]|nr:hypothetical protein [Planctomycetota bacterium]
DIEHAPNTPANPGPEDAVEIADSTITLVWSGGDADDEDAVNYSVYLDTAEAPVEKIKTLKDTSHEVTDLKFGKKYYWKISASDGDSTTAGPVWSFTVAAQLILTAPDGGESLEAGTKTNIQWQTKGEIAKVDLDYSTDDGDSWDAIVSNLDNEDEYEWTVPDKLSSEVLVRVMETGGKLSDASDSGFAIVERRVLEITSPKAGDKWEALSSRDIKWNTSGGIAKVKIEYSLDSGETWSQVVKETVNDSSHAWTLPAETSELVFMRISDLAGEVVFTNEEVFIITDKRTISVDYPKGGEVFEVEGADSLKWSFTGEIARVKLEYGKTDAWELIADSLENTGVFAWEVPEAVAADHKLRVSDVNGDVSAESENAFAILEKRTLSLDYPKGGEVIEAGGIDTIRWAHTGEMPKVKLEYGKT